MKSVIKKRTTTKEYEKYTIGYIKPHAKITLFLPLYLYKFTADPKDYPKPGNSICIETDRGRIEFFNGRLTERHCSIVEILLINYESYNTHLTFNKHKEPCRTCQFTAHQLAKDLRIGNVRRDWIIKRLNEMMETSFKITNTKIIDLTEKCLRIFDNVQDVYNSKEEKNIIQVQFNPEFLALRKHDKAIDQLQQLEQLTFISSTFPNIFMS